MAERDHIARNNKAFLKQTSDLCCSPDPAFLAQARSHGPLGPSPEQLVEVRYYTPGQILRIGFGGLGDRLRLGCKITKTNTRGEQTIHAVEQESVAQGADHAGSGPRPAVTSTKTVSSETE